MSEHGFHKTQADHCVFVKRYDEGDFLILLLYVDDMLVVSQDTKKIASLKKALRLVNGTYAIPNISTFFKC